MLVLAAAVLAVVPLAGASHRVPAGAARAADTGTFGQMQVGSLVERGGANWLDFSGPYRLSTSVSVTKLTAYVAGGSAVSHLRGVIYNAYVGPGDPAAPVAVTPEVTIPAGKAAGWIDLPFSAPVTLPVTDGYWLGYWYGDTNSLHYYVDVTGSERYAPATYSATGVPPSYPASLGSSSSYSLYATYTSTGGAAPVNTAAPVITYSQPTFPNYAFTTTQGTWTNAPTSFSYKWCLGPSDAVNQNCSTPRSTGPTMTLQWPSGDGTVWVGVTATNAAGSTTAQTYISFSRPEFTVYTVPTVAVDGGGAPHVGSTVWADRGAYLGVPSGAPPPWFGWVNLTWLRCDASGVNCVPFGSSGGDFTFSFPYTLTSADVGSTIRVLAWSDNLSGGGRRIAIASAPTAVVTP
jgi:hypothetical protein